MASNSIDPSGELVTLPGTIPPMPAVARILSRFDRAQLHGFIAVAIDLADAMDGDSDSLDTDDAEDSFAFTGLANAHRENTGPGCDIADAGENAWIEWHTMRGSQKRGPNIAAGHEDDEEDDPAEDDDPTGQCDEDGINTALHAHGIHRFGPGCELSDPSEPDGGRPFPV